MAVPYSFIVLRFHCTWSHQTFANMPFKSEQNRYEKYDRKGQFMNFGNTKKLTEKDPALFEM